MNEPERGNDNSLREQLINGTKELLEEYQNKQKKFTNQSFDNFLNRINTDIKLDLHQILIKLNDNTPSILIKKKFHKLKVELKENAEKHKNTENLIELCNNETKVEVKATMETILKHFYNQEHNIDYLRKHIQDELNQKLEMIKNEVIIISNNIKVTDERNEKRKDAVLQDNDGIKKLTEGIGTKIEDELRTAVDAVTEKFQNHSDTMVQMTGEVMYNIFGQMKETGMKLVEAQIRENEVSKQATEKTHEIGGA
jgi:hypothetical protein